MTDIQFQNAFTASLDYLAGRVKELHPELANKAFSGNELVVVDVGSGMMSYLKGMVQWASARNPNYKIIAVDKCPPIDVLLESEEVYKGRFAYMQSPIEKAGK